MDIGALFEEGGQLANSLTGYRYRGAQVAMAKVVEQSLGGGHFVLEAEAGIGKSFAYLTPLIESQTQTLISTGSRILQDQLLHKDIPFLAKALHRPVKAVVLKGRANYACHLMIEENSKATLEIDDAHAAEWQGIVEFAATSRTGDIAHSETVLADSPAWRKAVSTRESCSVARCPHYDRCFLYRARAQARDADIVIVNHHLFLSDLRLKDEGVAEILPNFEVVLFDEAHVLPALAPQLLGESLSSSQLVRVAKDVEHWANKAELQDDEGGDNKFGLMAATARQLRQAVNQWLLKSSVKKFPQEVPAAALGGMGWEESLSAIQEEVLALHSCLPNTDRGRKWKERLASIDEFLTIWENEQSGEQTPRSENSPPSETNPAAETETRESELPASSVPLVRWAKTSEHAITLMRAPVSGQDFFTNQWQQQNTVIFTSATFGGKNGLDSFCEVMGLSEPAVHTWDSPYEFQKQAVMYLPNNLPQPNDADFNQAVVEAVLPLIRANGGRALLLFTTHRALSAASEYLRATLTSEGYRILKQGDMPNDTLLDTLRNTSRCVLLGSRMFWQGVDIKGDALSLVMVDKIPFAPPDDPLHMALEEWRKTRGESSFQMDQIPNAIILMQQAAGRLIRDFEDYGVFMVADPRLRSKAYGRQILKSLPPMKQSSDATTAIDFLTSAIQG